MQEMALVWKMRTQQVTVLWAGLSLNILNTNLGLGGFKVLSYIFSDVVSFPQFIVNCLYF